MKLSVAIRNLVATALIATSALTGCASDVDEPIRVDTACLDGCADVAGRRTEDGTMSYLEVLGHLDKTLAYGDLIDIDWPVAEQVIIAQDGEMDDTGRELLDNIVRDSLTDHETWAIAVLATRADDAETLHVLEAKVAQQLKELVKLQYEEIPTLVPGQTQ